MKRLSGVKKWICYLAFGTALLSAVTWMPHLISLGQSQPSAQEHMRLVESEIPNTGLSLGDQPNIKAIGGDKESKKPIDLSQRFADRKVKVNEYCQKYKPESQLEHPNFITNDFAFGRLIHCQIPKVGTTFLKYLTNRVFYPKSGKPENSPWPEQERKTFTLVREPYTRLVSAYFDKFVTLVYWWSWANSVILKRFRPNSYDEENCGNDVTFPEFVKYLIYAQENRSNRDNHFIPMHEQCNICHSDFDFISKLETFKEDFNFILQSVNVSVDWSHQDHEEEGIKSKIKSVFNREDMEMREGCETLCTTLRKLWWSFQVRGFIYKDMHFPLDEKDCIAISSEEFSNIAWSAHERFVGFDKKKQKRDAIVELYLQVSLKDRLHLKEIFQIDFDMFGYDPMPVDLFPEIKESYVNSNITAK